MNLRVSFNPYPNWLALLLMAGVVLPLGAEVRFEKIVIDAGHKGEAAAVMDVSRSGHLSVVCGENWYEATDPSLRQWRKHSLRKIEYKSEYYDDFGNLVMDVNGDGYPDIVSGGWFSMSLSWYENPGKVGGEWKGHLIDSPGNIETLRLWSVAGDGRPAVVPNAPGKPLLWYELKRTPAGQGGGGFIKHEIPGSKTGHGLGFGDVNGDGREDFITTIGWYEAPLDRRAGKWEYHADFKLGHLSIPVLVHDVNSDGLPDLIYGNPHDYGLFWLEQKRGPDGARRWLRHAIDLRWSQVHAIALGDLDGDGRPELIAGKRYRAHNDGDPGGKDPCVLYYYSFDQGGRFTRHTIDEGNKVGCGIDLLVTDVNNDGRLDLVCPGKGGLYLFLNRGSGPSAAKATVSPEEARLLGILQSPAPLAEKKSACRELSRVGTAESVMVLGELLEDPRLSDDARAALEAIPSGAAEAALRRALGTAKGPLLAEVISSITARGERWARPELLPLLKDPHLPVVSASALALGRIAHPQAIKAIQDTMKQAKEPARSAMVAGLLAAGKALCERKQFKDAVPIYLELLDEKLPETVAAARSALAGLPETARDERVRQALDAPRP